MPTPEKTTTIMTMRRITATTICTKMFRHPSNGADWHAVGPGGDRAGGICLDGAFPPDRPCDRGPRHRRTTAFFPAETLIELNTIAAGTTRIMTALTLAAQGLVVLAIFAGLLAVLDLQRRGLAVLRAMGTPAGFVFLVIWL